MPTSTNYPENVANVIDDDMVFRRQAVRAVKNFARSKPWRGSIDSRKRKFCQALEDLKQAYEIENLTIRFQNIRSGRSSDRSYYDPNQRKIVIDGNLSVVTFFHEFAHAKDHALRRPMTETRAVKWSVNMFKRRFPRSFARSVSNNHLIRRSQRTPQIPTSLPNCELALDYVERRNVMLYGSEDEYEDE